MKLSNFEDAFKKAQQSKSASRYHAIEKEYRILQSMSGFRGVRKDIFELNRKTLAMSFKYLNQKNRFDLTIPAYTRKIKRLTASFAEMVHFQNRHDVDSHLESMGDD